MSNLIDKSSALKNMTTEQLKVLASDIRADILSSVNTNGGHLSSNLGFVELTMALLANFDPLVDDLLFDVGHQTYTYKILTGRSLKALRKLGGEGPFSSRFDSPYDKYCNGHASTSISVGLGMDIAKRLENDKSYTIAIIGDSSVSSGLSMEALNLLSTQKNSRLMVIINDNGMSIGKDIGFMAKKFQYLRNSRFYFRTSNAFGKGMSKHKFTWKIFLKLRNLKDHFKSMILKDTVFEAMGLKYIGPFDGHDFLNLDLAIKKAKSLVENGPIIVHIITKKGYGYPQAAKDSKGDYHGVAPYFAEPEVNTPKTDYTSLKETAIQNLMKKDSKVFVITPAMEKGSNLETIFKTYPERCLDVGIAEENAVTLASGLALKGYKPIVDIYSTFMQRSYDEIFEDISRERIPVLFIVERCGLAGGDGASHHGLYDVAMVKSIPYTSVYMPFDQQTNQLLFDRVAFKKNIPVFFRYSKEELLDTLNGECTENFVKYNKFSSDCIYIGVGPKGYLCLNELKDLNIDKFMLLNLLPDDSVLNELNLNTYKRIYFYDPYGIYQGTAELLSDHLKRQGYSGEFITYAFKKAFYTFGDNKSLYEKYHLDFKEVSENIIRLEKSRFVLQ